MRVEPLAAVAVVVLATLVIAPASGTNPVPLITTDETANSAPSSWVDNNKVWTTIDAAGSPGYNTDECSWIETEVLPGTVLTGDATLRFDYEHDLEFSPFSGTARDASVVLLSVDAGATWAAIDSGLENTLRYFSAIRSCLDDIGVSPHPLKVISGQGSGRASVDLSSVAPSDMFQVRLVLATDSFVARDGWTVSNIELGYVPKVLQLASGGEHNCVLIDDGTVDCWGDDQYNQVSGGYTGSVAAVGTEGGWDHSCALLADGDVACWGLNNHNQVTGGYSGTVAAIGVAAGDGHTCAVLSDGTVTCWGDDFFNQVSGTYSGSVPAIDIAAGGQHSCALLIDGTVDCWGWDANNQVSGGYTGTIAAIGVAGGFDHSCALLANGDVECWGRDHHNQVSGGYTGTVAAIQVAAAGHHSCALLADGTVTCWGSNNLNQVSGGYTGTTPAIQVDAGHWHTCALLADNTVTCWGHSGSGQTDPYP